MQSIMIVVNFSFSMQGFLLRDADPRLALFRDKLVALSEDDRILYSIDVTDFVVEARNPVMMLKALEHVQDIGQLMDEHIHKKIPVFRINKGAQMVGRKPYKAVLEYVARSSL